MCARLPEPGRVIAVNQHAVRANVDCNATARGVLGQIDQDVGPQQRLTTGDDHEDGAQRDRGVDHGFPFIQRQLRNGRNLLFEQANPAGPAPEVAVVRDE